MDLKPFVPLKAAKKDIGKVNKKLWRTRTCISPPARDEKTAMDVAMVTTIFGGWGITAVNDDCDCHNVL